MELGDEKRRVIQGALAALIFCTIALSLGCLVLPRWFRFPVDLPDRLAFGARADLFVLLWVIVGVVRVAWSRGRSAVDIAGAVLPSPGTAIAVQVAFLQNTLEQAVVAVGAHLALVTLLDGPALALIAVAVVLFGIGRFAFLIGYPHGAGSRAFGMATTFIPTGAGYAIAIGLMIYQAFFQ